jgi:hypothetical protein
MRQTWGKKLAIVIAFALAITPLLTSTANAALLSPRNLTLIQGIDGGDLDTVPDGGSQPSGNSNHQFNFTIPTGGNVGSVRFEYCTTTEGTCTMPTGLSTSSATAGTQSGATGFTINTSTNGVPYLTRTAANVTAATAVSLQLNGVTNPSTVGTFFVRIQTYTAAALGGTVTDAGVVAASTAQQIVLTGTMPESLIFCTGGTVNANCSSTTSGNIAFNQLFSPTDTATATSQMAASTNAAQGYVITVNGPTLTSGSATIPGWTAATSAGTNRGASRWGLNLKANTATTSTVPVGAEITSASNGTDLKGQALTGYNTVDQFKFVTGDAVANSAYDGASNTTLGPTNSQVYTASYAVNVAGNQLAGTYVSTLTYICTPTF